MSRKRRAKMSEIWNSSKFIYTCAVVLFVTATIGDGSCRPRPRIQWRSDGRCGPNFPLPSGAPGQCDPNSERPCCSDYGYCGISVSHCSCTACFDYRNVVQEPGCYFLLDKLTGFMESPNFPDPYPLEQDCCFDIQRPSEEYCGVTLQVEFLDVGRPEEDRYCKRDWISLPSCVPERGTRICGNNTDQYYQYLFQPGANAIRFVFHAGQLNEGRKGFRIRYELEEMCSGPYQTQLPPVSSIPKTQGAPCYTRITDERGTINTPYFPNNYPRDLDCVYEFMRTSNKVCGISMKSVRFIMDEPISTPFGGACTDFLHMPSCGFLCGNVNFSWTVHFQPGATSLKFHFHSDNNSSQPMAPGFLINFQHVTRCS